MIEFDQFYIDGSWTDPASSSSIAVISPSTQETVGRAPKATTADLDRAVAAARRAFDDGQWTSLTPAERGAYVAAIGRALESRRERFAEVLAAEAGLPIGLWATIDGALSFINYYAALAENESFEEIRQGPTSRVAVHREPVGVVGAILPWNSPLSLAFIKIAPALVAGCTVVFKADPETPLHALMLGEVFEEAGLPPGVVNILPAGPEVSAALVAHACVDKISFTGSTATGRLVGETCGRLLKDCNLELGGKSAAILLEDVDLPQVLPWLAGTSLMNNGEACVLQSRVLAPRSRYAEVSEALSQAAAGMRVGDPFDPAVYIGPLITERQRGRVEGYIARGLAAGAKLAHGGSRPAGLDRGWYVEPTVLVDVDNSMEVAREEIFGPVVSVIPYDNEADAIAIANDSPYGLSGTVWTSDLERGMSVAKRVQTGNYGINTFGMDPCAPFGGYKASGVGRELGPEGLDAFLHTKSIHLPPNWTDAE
jgi:betaine-aldehyde dehydrogenase